MRDKIILFFFTFITLSYSVKYDIVKIDRDIQNADIQFELKFTGISDRYLLFGLYNDDISLIMGDIFLFDTTKKGRKNFNDYYLDNDYKMHKEKNIDWKLISYITEPDSKSFILKRSMITCDKYDLDIKFGSNEFIIGSGNDIKWNDIEKYSVKRIRKFIGNTQIPFSISDNYFKMEVQINMIEDSTENYCKLFNIDPQMITSNGSGFLYGIQINIINEKYQMINLGNEHNVKSLTIHICNKSLSETNVRYFQANGFPTDGDCSLVDHYYDYCKYFTLNHWEGNFEEFLIEKDNSIIISGETYLFVDVKLRDKSKNQPDIEIIMKFYKEQTTNFISLMNVNSNECSVDDCLPTIIPNECFDLSIFSTKLVVDLDDVDNVKNLNFFGMKSISNMPKNRYFFKFNKVSTNWKKYKLFSFVQHSYDETNLFIRLNNTINSFSLQSIIFDYSSISHIPQTINTILYIQHQNIFSESFISATTSNYDTICHKHKSNQIEYYKNLFNSKDVEANCQLDIRSHGNCKHKNSILLFSIVFTILSLIINL
ncbi:hypothetical protein SNEBB_002329 [Seison nebaliae]|nr:hypothetical protein SNEBB_002329 [Seison nebaliae]